MKQLALVVILICSITTYSQNRLELQDIDKQKGLINLNNHLKNDTIWVLDSIYNYLRPNDTSEILLWYRELVQLRNTSGNTTISLQVPNDEFPNNSINNLKDSISYFNDSEIKHKESWVLKKSSSSWIMNEMTQYVAPDRLAEKFSKGWNDYLNTSLGPYRFVNHYAGNTVDSSYHFDYEPISDSWIEDYLRLHFIDESQNDTMEIIMKRADNTWVDSIKISRTFINDRLYEEVNQKLLSTGNWTQDTRKVLHYNEIGLEDTVSIFSWDNSSNLWIAMYQYIYEYDSSGRLIISKNRSFNYSIQQIVNNRLLEIFYSPISIIEVEKIWSLASQNWINSTHQYYSIYDENIYDTIRIMRWNSELDVWDPYRETIVDYDNSMNPKESTISYYMNNTWDIYWKAEFHWNPFRMNSIDYKNTPYISVFPNPANGIINFTLPENIVNSKIENQIYIYNISGKLVDIVALNGNHVSFDCTNIPNGIYIIKSGILSGKFIVTD